MEKETSTWTTTHNHTTGDFVCEFGNGLAVSVDMKLKRAYKTKDGIAIDNFSIDGMHIDVFYRILVGIVKSL